MRNHRRIGLLMVLLSLAACSGDKTPAPAATAPAPAPAAPAATPPPATTPAAAPASTSFSREELDQMVAPIALYPDPLLAQVLMAATYPGNVADAAAWSKANPNAKGDDAVKQVASQPWDPSVQALVAFPQALDTLGQDPAWVQRLGDAFLAQPNEVMDAVQRLRRQAQAAGNLSSNQYQNVTVQAAPTGPAPAAAPSDGGGGGGGGTTIIQEPQPQQTIIIEPSDPEVVYVPSYNPTTVYGSWAYPSYPPAYYPPSPGYYAGSALMAGLAFGTGIAVTNALWGDCDWGGGWGGGDVDIDVNRYNNINTNRQINNSNWQHNSLNRDGVPYRDNANRERYGRQLDGAQNRNQFRGDDPGRADARNRARSSMENRGIGSPAGSNREARDRAQAANRDLRNNPQARERLEGGGARDRAQGAGQSRDAQRQRAQSAAQQHASRDRSKPTDLGGNRPDAAKDLASRDRSQNADRERARAAAGGGAGNRSQADRQRAQQTAQNRQAQNRQRPQQSNNQARQQARSQQASRQAPRNNAMSGARNPQQSRQQANRGHSSQASARRPQQSRGGGGGGGHQVQRQSRPPQRQGGGGHRR